MSYIEYKDYIRLYKSIPITDFDRLSWEACRKIDAATTGADGVKKLKYAFPTDEDNAEAVKRCACALVNTLYQIQQAEYSAKSTVGYTETENGLQPKVISSISAGNESVSFAVGSNLNTKTVIDKALSDKTMQNQIFNDTIHEYLSGISDANGVNLLFMGRYPYRLEKE